ncbi:hypothetical protein M91_04188 [Bos mutus]|uniref:Neuronal membrane glycoprotein M6-a n=1 Tax=Bos mutus TaxID=72004 RepID=L8INK0_9CETA|nr:hypothetical protein M91_04188 [Bos mutus]
MVILAAQVGRSRRHNDPKYSGCFECCIKCLGGIPYASLIATILLYAGVALFCGCGHEALSGTVNILQTYFEMARTAGDTLDVFTMIDIFKYVIYGIAAAFFVYGILLMVEGFFTTGAIKDLYGDFKITTCGRCVSAWSLVYSACSIVCVEQEPAVYMGKQLKEVGDMRVAMVQGAPVDPAHTGILDRNTNSKRMKGYTPANQHLDTCESLFLDTALRDM